MSDDASASDRAGASTRLSRQTLVTFVVVVATLVLNLAQQPGLITFDTKLDLQFDPGGFMSRSLSLWNGDSAVGGLQNQASGYLFPMGPAFWVGDVLGVPMWIWERLWSAALMLLAYGGVRRLAASWPGIGPRAAVLAGLAYMLAPRVLITVGGLSGETLPAAVLPWTVLPLVLYLRGAMRARVALLCSAATVPWMGGQNATLVLACLVLPGLLLLLVEGRRWRRRLRDVAAWSALVVLISLWWLVPLFLLGGYAPPFLDFIETSANTARRIGWMTSLRGTSHWVAFFPTGGGAGWSGGYALLSSSLLLVTTVLTAGLGLLGLAREGLWARRVLVSAVLVGLTVLTLGSGGWAGSLLAGSWLEALNGSLAPLRNVHKFDPLLRLPIALGIGAFVTSGLPLLVARVRRLPAARASAVTLALTAVVALVVGAAAQPAAAGKLRNDGGMEDISSSWRDAVDYLDDRPGHVSVLVLPGSGFATQYWGRTVDEPLQVLGGPPWLARAQVTVAPAGTLRMMDSIERSIGEGRPQPGLADAVRRLGVTHVVVRNDLDLDETDAPAREVVYASLAGASDLRSVAGFGRASSEHPEVEVFALDDPGSDPRFAMMDWDERQVVQGGQEVIDDLLDAGLVGPGQATVLAGGGAQDATSIVTDSNQRVERTFGRVHAATSGVMTADEEFRLDRPVHDFVGDQVPAPMTTAEYDGAVLITASSSKGYADVLGPVRPAAHPYAAFDDSVFTAWSTAPFRSPDGEWIEARFDDAVDPGPVDLQFDPGSGAEVDSVRLTTDGGSRTVRIGADGRASGIDLPGTTTRAVRMTVLKTSGGGREVRLADFRMRNHAVRRTLRLPGEVGSRTAVHLSSELSRRSCVVTEPGVACEESWQRETPETTGFDRTAEVSESGRWRLAGRAVVTNGPAPEKLLAPLSEKLVRVSATSTFGGDPAVAAANVFDGRPETGWYSSPLDQAPGVQLSWRKKRLVKDVRAVLTRGQPGSLPSTVVVDPQVRGEEPQLVATTGPGAGRMTPVRTNRLRVTTLEDPDRDEGVGISELEIDGLEDLRFTSDPDTPTGTVCGFGPVVAVGTSTVQTRLTGTLGDLRSGAELDVEPCGAPSVPMEEGDQRIRVTNPAGFAVSRLWLVPESGFSASSSAVTGEVTSWSPTERSLRVETEREAVLALVQSSNRGWQASVEGTRLEPVVVDGWRQGWRVPAGTSGDVQMRFAPQGAFRLSIVLGLVTAALLSAAALAMLLLGRRRPVRPRPHAERAGPGLHAGPHVGVMAGVAGVLAIVSLPLSLGAALGYLTRRTGFAELTLGCLGALGVATLLALVEGRVVVPPTASDVLVALVVGVVAGRVLTSSHRSQEDGP